MKQLSTPGIAVPEETLKANGRLTGGVFRDARDWARAFENAAFPVRIQPEAG